MKVLQEYEEAKKSSDIIALIRSQEKKYLTLLYETKAPELRTIYAAKAEVLNKILFEIVSLPWSTGEPEQE